MRPLIFAAAFCVAAPVWADVPTRLEAAFLGWAKDVGASKAVMTIRDMGAFERDVTLGMTADTLVETASLSKAITAACAAQMADDGLWTMQTTSFEQLGYGAKGITLAQLLSQSSGIGPDQTQFSMMLWVDKDADHTEQVAKTALTREKQSGQAGAYLYNNENYAIVGAMIEARTGQLYEEACAERVLAPAGITTAEKSPRSGAFLPWGGWQMAVQDYAAFHWHVFGPKGIVGADPSRWPAVDIDGGYQYGMGTFQRAMRTRHNYWHFGALCFPWRLNIGSYAVIWLDGYSVVAAYDVCPSWDEMGTLDRVLVEAVFQ